MTFTKADIAQKVANECGFLKGEAMEIVEKLLEIMKRRLMAGRRYDLRLRKVVR